MNKYRKKYPERAKANFAVNNAVRLGKMIKPKNCEVCQKKARIEGHHSNYAEQLKIIWVCSQCHKNIHFPNKRYTSAKLYKRKPVSKPHHKKFQPAPKKNKLFEIAKKMRDKGISYNNISKELKISIGTAYKWLNPVLYF